MNKNYKFAGVIAVVIVALIVGFIFLGPERGIVNDEDVFVNDEDLVTPDGEVDFGEVRRIDLLRYPVDTSREDIATGAVSGEITDVFNRGDLLVADVLMEEIEGINYSVRSRIVDPEGRDAFSAGRVLSPLEVRGGGAFKICCFEIFQAGDFNFLLLIDGNEAASKSFWVEPEE